MFNITDKNIARILNAIKDITTLLHVGSEIAEIINGNIEKHRNTPTVFAKNLKNFRFRYASRPIKVYTATKQVSTMPNTKSVDIPVVCTIPKNEDETLNPYW